MAKREKAIAPTEVSELEVVKQDAPVVDEVPVVEEVVTETEVPAPVVVAGEPEPIVNKIIIEGPVVIEPMQPVSKEIPSTAFGLVGEDYPWAWNMSNISGKYWFSCIDAGQYAELKSDAGSDFKKFVANLIRYSGMPVVVREPRNSMFVHVSEDGITESTVIYL
ncbi:hypothetical protein Aeh1ORF232c [Aeromonas phage Aeh1]|uniref:Uncharacterized protein n=1 Tax=Aeromonas phage Aeh1 TaxID=2880362 RepID=Q76YK2_9CAUD|nr:hypothetical protein Aeh1p243 [Aeromonas phage Aeh1]AAQ17893.1 hypothetical protein Aeh1ORF232c [Aeromonas phage Aeh1]